MKLLRRILLGLVVIAAVLYAAAVGYMYVNQRALQYDAAGPVTPLAETALDGAEDIVVPSGDGQVHGWYQAPQPGKPVIVYFKGNSGSFSKEHERYEQFVADGYGFVAFDYRGFPASPGSVSQAGILEDATTMFDWAAAKGFPLVIWGRSLGSGPSTYVASLRDAKALLLETPFLSALTVAWERYPFLPVGLVMQDQYPVNEWIADVAEPVLVAHGTADLTIGVSNGERLYALVPNKDELWIEPGAGHSDLWARGIWGHALPFFERAMPQ
ncbi:alpha/beta hydrolase [Devosia sp. SL43]|uniref:alpha/beta hydrolase n=1 Tax=Devosia sp. SL43 TaxID=2806348 RepID=UPI001F38E2DE|nr:alpha/beta hydrolase [Devosia sp. SL43]UJW87392.1 alpha/beta hydrolase [Devosia sp. SL43]